MAHFSTTVRTSLAPAEAFAFLADVRRFPEWDPGTKSVKQTTGDGPGIGSVYELKTPSASLTYATEAFSEPTSFRIRGRNTVVTSVDSVSVAADGTGSVVTYDAELTPNGVFKLAGFVFSRMFDKLGNEAADGLAATLPDGARLT